VEKRSAQFCATTSGPVHAGVRYRNLFLFLNFIPALINVYYNHLTFSTFLTVCHCFAFKKYTGTSKFPLRALATTGAKQPLHDTVRDFTFDRMTFQNIGYHNFQFDKTYFIQIVSSVYVSPKSKLHFNRSFS